MSQTQVFGHWLSARIGVVLALAILTVLVRFPVFGDPNYHIDESFYLLVGQKMHDGLLPYVDIWDRKPAGLFVIYWAITFFGDVYAYQVAAGLFAFGTALAIALIAERISSRTAGVIAGALYLCLIGALAGGGGQSPVFYNLFVAVAGLLVIGTLHPARNDRHHWPDYAAMLLCGLALTFKPTAVAEGIFFGVVFLVGHWRANQDLGSLALFGIRLVIVGVLPTFAIWLAFFAIDAFEQYWFAAMQSVFLTDSLPDLGKWIRVRWLAMIIWLPVLLSLAGLIALYRRSDDEARVYTVFLGGWLVAAMVGFFLVPNFFDHYALPLATILAICAAPVFDRKLTGPILGVVACGSLLVLSGYPVGQVDRTAASKRSLAEASALIGRNLSGGCLFVYDVSPSLLRPFDDCMVTKYIFPEHLSNQREAPAIGEDPVDVITYILARRPNVIVKSSRPSIDTPNWETLNILEDRLAKDYSLVGKVRLRDVVGVQDAEVWALD